MRDYIADFSCFSSRLIIEADGKAHRDPDYDTRRDAWFKGEGFTVLRFSNEVVVTTPDRVIGTILAVADRAPNYSP
jgi:very-short-patch-repair endonuclease